MSTPNKAVTSTGISVTRDLVVNLPPIPISAQRARQFAHQTLRNTGLSDPTLSDRVALVVSELVTNSILHAGTEVQIRLSVDGPAFCVEVTDGAPSAAYDLPVAPLATSGRGLVLVDAVADSWGVADVDGGRGKKVWARLTIT